MHSSRLAASPECCERKVGATGVYRGINACLQSSDIFLLQWTFMVFVVDGRWRSLSIRESVRVQHRCGRATHRQDVCIVATFGRQSSGTSFLCCLMLRGACWKRQWRRCGFGKSSGVVQKGHFESDTVSM